MGEIYLAEDTSLGRQIALKVLPREVAGDQRRQARFVQEARAASALNHPNIVTVHEIGSDAGIDFLVMEYVGGKPLAEMIPPKGMPVKEALRYAVQIADALARAHAAGIIHRDLKPENIMVTADGRIKLLDFGLAKSADAPLSPRPGTMEGEVLGTVGYMSPEQAQGLPADARSDIFSFGAVLHEMITGQRPFPEIVTAAPPELDRIVRRCLRKDPELRWQAMSDLKAVLEDLIEDSARPGRIAAGSAAAAPRRSWPWIAGGVLLVIGAAGSLWVGMHRRGRAPELQAPFTYDSGLTTWPAISPDGKLAAYVSDRAEGHLDLWVQHIGGRQPIRLTHDEAGAMWPSFSPDGSRIFFQSGRPGGGIFSIDALGGDIQSVVDSGFAPRLSPDGSRIAYYREGPPWYTAKMFTVPAQGGASVPFQPAFSLYAADRRGAAPVWSPDGDHILFPGTPDKSEEPDWYVGAVSPSGAEAAATGFARNVGLADVQFPCAWAGDYIYYGSGTPAEGVNLYRVRIAARTWRISGPAERLTSGPGMQVQASLAGDGRMLFVNFNWEAAIWSTPLDAERGAITGERRRVTTDQTMKLFPAVSHDGRKVVFVSFGGVQNRRIEVRLRDLASGAESVYPAREPAQPDEAWMVPRLSRDGSLLAYVENGPGKQAGYVVKPSPGVIAARRVCTGCRVLGFFAGGDLLVLNENTKLVRQRQESEVGTPLASANWFGDAALSPDDRWLALEVHRADFSTAIQLAPAGAEPTPESEWITAAAGAGYLACPRWSRDGRLVYYLSDRDGHDCIWAQRVDPVSKKPTGEPFAVLHEHRARYALNVPRGLGTFDVANGRLVYWMAEITGNIWWTKVDLDGPSLFRIH